MEFAIFMICQVVFSAMALYVQQQVFHYCYLIPIFCPCVWRLPYLIATECIIQKHICSDFFLSGVLQRNSPLQLGLQRQFQKLVDYYMKPLMGRVTETQRRNWMAFWKLQLPKRKKCQLYLICQPNSSLPEK